MVSYKSNIASNLVRYHAPQLAVEAVRGLPLTSCGVGHCGARAVKSARNGYV